APPTFIVASCRITFSSSVYTPLAPSVPFSLFFFNAPPPPEIYTLSLHDALPISSRAAATSDFWGPGPRPGGAGAGPASSRGTASSSGPCGSSESPAAATTAAGPSSACGSAAAIGRGRNSTPNPSNSRTSVPGPRWPRRRLAESRRTACGRLRLVDIPHHHLAVSSEAGG